VFAQDKENTDLAFQVLLPADNVALLHSYLRRHHILYSVMATLHDAFLSIGIIMLSDPTSTVLNL
jgi:hypothetical protein